MLAFLRSSMVYISAINTHIINYNLSYVNQVIIAQWLAQRLATNEVTGSYPSKAKFISDYSADYIIHCRYTLVHSPILKIVVYSNILRIK